MVSFYIGRSDKAALVKLAEQRQQTQAETLRAIIDYSLAKMPKGWTPK